MKYTAKVSIIMAVYNGEKYLKKSVDSVLGQSYTNYECIIINDGSNDNTKSILNSICDSRLHIIHQENGGPGAARNRGIHAARGEFLAIMDADDISLPDRLEKQVAYLENNKDYVLIGSNSFLINEIGEHVGIFDLPKSDTEIRWTILFRNPFCHSTVMMRGDVLRNNGIKYDENLKTAQDFDFLSKIMKFGKTKNFEQPLVEYRVHPDQIGNLHITDQQKNALSISRENLADMGFNLSESEVIRLRKWAFVFPSNIRKEDIHLLNRLIIILKKFKFQPLVDLNSFNDIKFNYIWKICNAINMENMFAVLFSKLFIHVFFENGLLCLKNISERILSRCNRYKLSLS